mgnify:CR=1 FL=1
MTFKRILGAACAAVVAGLAASSAASAAPPANGTCTGGPVAGTYANLRITGSCSVADDARLSVLGTMTLAQGAVFNAVSMGQVDIGGNVLVGRGATFGLGCTVIGVGCPGDTHDVVGGSVVADHPLTMYLDGDTIRGSVLSTGGGPGPTFDPYVNYPIKDNVIGGNVLVQGWQGAWFGFIRNHAGGNVVISGNVGVAVDENGTPDSTEVVTNTIGGNLVCTRNDPVAQIGDSGGTPNVVGGLRLGECAGL